MQIISQLSKELTPELLAAENSMLFKIVFNQESINGRSTDQKTFSPLCWYSAAPSDQDELYKMVEAVLQVITTALHHYMESDHQIEKKESAGQSTQYLLLISDEERGLLAIDQVLALYLLDVAYLCNEQVKKLQAVNGGLGLDGTVYPTGVSVSTGNKKKDQQNADKANGYQERN